MKNRSLFRKSMVLIIVPIIVVSLLLIFVSTYVIENYFRADSYERLYSELSVTEDTIEEASVRTPSRPGMPSSGLKKGDLPSANWSPRLTPSKSVQSTYVTRVGESHFHVVGSGDALELFELDPIIGNETWPLDGEISLGTETVFYSIMPVTDETTLKRLSSSDVEGLYQIAYISESYSASLSRMVIKVYAIGLSILVLTVSLILFYVFRHMTGRLHELEKGSAAIGKGNFQTILAMEPYDEIGRLGEAMNGMSQQLGLNQEEQADQFQMISHELKTPIMVMKGYLDMLIHGQFPSGSREATYKVLEEELNKMELLTQDIITLNKLEYLARNKVEMTHLSIRSIFEEAIDRMQVRDSVAVTLSGDMTLLGDHDSWTHVVENLLTNHVRYAESLIEVTLGEAIQVKNDGPPIEEHLLERIKKPFVKGKSGRSGLGLAIVVNILKLYHFTLEIENCEDGVLYTISKEA